jgi:hypothetical protein
MQGPHHHSPRQSRRRWRRLSSPPGGGSLRAWRSRGRPQKSTRWCARPRRRLPASKNRRRTPAVPGSPPGAPRRGGRACTRALPQGDALDCPAKGCRQRTPRPEPARREPALRPLRPMRCRNAVTEGGVSICTTRSRSPTSMPSSSVLVATMTQSGSDANAASA